MRWFACKPWRSAILLLPVGMAFGWAAAAAACAGDCAGDGEVTVDEVVTCVNIALGIEPVSTCLAGDVNGDGGVTVDELLGAVSSALNGCSMLETPTPIAAPSATATATATPQAEPVPTNPADLLAWLQAGNYLAWPAESGRHASNAGAHTSAVRTFVNEILFDSLQAGNAAHPAGAAAVKELYGSSLAVQGWAVSVKMQDSSASGDGWYWYEGTSSFVLEGVGLGICTGCHGDDFREYVSKDFVLSPFPLQ